MLNEYLGGPVAMLGGAFMGGAFMTLIEGMRVIVNRLQMQQFRPIDPLQDHHPH